MLREGQGRAEARSRRGQDKVKERSRQRKHNVNCNYNLKGFDTIEINLVYVVNAIQLLENSRYNYLPRVKLVGMSSYMSYHHTVINYTNTILLMFFGS